MIDLSSPQIQAACRRLQRTSVAATVLMCIFTALGIGITVWASTLGPRDSATWAEVMFFTLLGVIVLFFAFILVWEFVNRRTFVLALHRFVAERFYVKESDMLGAMDGAADYELAEGGDKLYILRAQNGALIELDLSPVKAYASVCAGIARYAKNFIRDYYLVNAKNAGIMRVTLTDRVQRREKNYVYVEDGEPKGNEKLSYYIRREIIK